MVSPSRRRSEHPSLAAYLQENVPAEDLDRVGIISFNQWPFSLAILAEVALTLNRRGSDVCVGLWADDTPLPDPGWSTSRAVARALLSPTVDQRTAKGLVGAGLPASSVVRPPMRRWKPQGLPPVPEPLTRAAIRTLTYRGSGMGRSILQVHPDLNTPVSDSHVWPRRWIEHAMTSYAWAYDQTRELIRTRRLTSLVVYNGRFTHDQAAAAAAEAEGIRVLYYELGGVETDFDLTIVPTHDWSDLQHRMQRMWQVWDPEDREAIATAWFEGRRTHTAPSVHRFVAAQTRGHTEGIPEAQTLVAFFSSSGDEFAELDLDWSEFVDSQEQALAVLAQECRQRPGMTLVVRTHPHMRLKPKDDLVDWTAAVDAAAPDVHLDPFSPVDSYELMQRADIVFTYGSTSGVEAAVLGASVVVMGPSAYDELGCARRIRRPEEIAPSLDNPPLPDADAALPFGLMMMRRGFTFQEISRTVEGTPVVGDVPLEEPSAPVQHLSHARLKRLKRRLTSD